MTRSTSLAALAFMAFANALSPIFADDSALPVVFTEDFSKGAAAWKPTDASAWKVTKESDNAVFELIKQSAYEPAVRSPVNIALYDAAEFGDFELTAKVKTTKESYGHRDLCFFFGHQDATHFYYVHFGQVTDDHANQIFIVNGEPRTKISTKTTKGTPWKDNHWHQVKITRDTASGTIKVYFDDMETPAMEATDKTFVKGKVGIGSFDDVGKWDDIQVRGNLAKP